MKLLTSLLVGAALMAMPANAQKNDGKVKETIATIEKVNDYWQSHHKAECRGFWDNAAYFTGNQAVYELTKK